MFFVWNPQVSAPITSETHTGGGAVIRKPGSAWLEGTPAIDLGHVNVVVKWMYLNVGSGLTNWNGLGDTHFLSFTQMAVFFGFFLGPFAFSVFLVCHPTGDVIA